MVDLAAKYLRALELGGIPLLVVTIVDDECGDLKVQNSSTIAYSPNLAKNSISRGIMDIPGEFTRINHWKIC